MVHRQQQLLLQHQHSSPPGVQRREQQQQQVLILMQPLGMLRLLVLALQPLVVWEACHLSSSNSSSNPGLPSSRSSGVQQQVLVQQAVQCGQHLQLGGRCSSSSQAQHNHSSSNRHSSSSSSSQAAQLMIGLTGRQDLAWQMH
jgi:hypothetical protein